MTTTTSDGAAGSGSSGGAGTHPQLVGAATGAVVAAVPLLFVFVVIGASPVAVLVTAVIGLSGAYYLRRTRLGRIRP